jgi:hypothetical protein
MLRGICYQEDCVAHPVGNARWPRWHQSSTSLQPPGTHSANLAEMIEAKLFNFEQSVIRFTGSLSLTHPTLFHGRTTAMRGAPCLPIRVSWREDSSRDCAGRAQR